MVPDPRNQNLNAAYWPQIPVSGNIPPSVTVPQGNTMFDPMAGTGWGQALDAMGASDPGGMALKGLIGTGPSPVQNAAPGVVQGPAPGTVQWPAAGTPANPDGQSGKVKGKTKAPAPGPQTGAMGGLKNANPAGTY